MNTDYDVVIVGGGLVGASLACALGSSALKVALLEAAPEPVSWRATPVDPRVSALTLASQSLLERLGAWPAMVAQRVTPYRHMRVWDAEGTGRIEFDADALCVPALGHIVENSVTVSSLHRIVAQHANIRLLRGVQVTALSEPQASARGPLRSLTLADQGELRAAVVVAADGAHSTLRQWAGFETREWDYNHHAIVTTVRMEREHGDTAWQRFLRTGPLAFLPITQGGDKHYSSIVWSCQPELAERLMALDEAAFAAELGAALEYRLGRIEQVDPRHCLPLRQRHAKQYVQPALALVGDAAHTIHPLAGQGVNLGLLDAATLAEELLRASERRQALGELAVLRRYQRRRMSDNLAMMGLMEGFKRLFAEQAPPVRWLRNAGMSWVNDCAPLKRQLVRQALGLRGGLPRLATPLAPV